MGNPSLATSMTAKANDPGFSAALAANANGPFAHLAANNYHFGGTSSDTIVTDDCTLTQWTSWGTCTTTCGVGSSTRTRAVNQTKTCEGNVCGKDCPSSNVVNT